MLVKSMTAQDHEILMKSQTLRWKKGQISRGYIDLIQILNYFRIIMSLFGMTLKRTYQG